MTKQAFLEQLQEKLCGLPKEDIEERVMFYSELIDDSVEDGLSEEESVCKLGDIESVVSQILIETPFSKIVKENIKSKCTFRVWKIVLLALGSPVWLSLLIAAFAVVFSVYISIWSIAISFWAVFGSLVGCFIGGFVASLIAVVGGNTLTGLALLGACVFCGGLSILMFFACRLITRGMVFLTKKIVLFIKWIFVRKERTK